ncbi:2-oxoglutarate and iron-dependent oxygenase domain-containing protein 3-like [Daphnia pulex]|uniref:2-oxoglutarate and iron-dependent oxygenase domain-containing protein 3-like n=1 Tax=Daphnia pulex TaxID=6669 RepID=UPI001EDF771B|nr:2-oxoglutarate and iron-dependent oxygenase domain-containing protein 3-like [Daphnia pulex]
MVSEVKQRVNATKPALKKNASESSKKKDSEISDEKKTAKSKDANIQTKFGPIGIKKEDQLWSRAVLMTGVLVIVIVMKWKKTNEITWVSRQDTVTKSKQPLICSTAFLDEINKFEGCRMKQCGRFVMDGLFVENQIDTLLGIFQKGLQFGHSSGGASILDLHSGALSKGERFINVFSNPETQNLWSEAELAFYTDAKETIRRAIIENFGLQPEAIHLTSPTFFSRMNENPAKTIHDEYWHPHVDKETYETFHFTSLLYLSDYGSEFQGGRFVFVDGDNMNRTVEPRRGRVSMFTSGGENLHYVEKVTQGTRYALTIAFTCDSRHAIPDPHIH